ncbi:hypothetical protein DQ244_12125 [Blastococcus sp. TBT05-19]|uniref:hypothetical protein n=1 Tax=Blastococcus sp. TBT05-19 TaxID=2250581 RepID=UPI000DE80647|nr:hypothetical protein [Blastococcus sp. TBT05-19]RBY90209.1 hypothetical protein DQ244_12125 [Blastococcus sp. TBT05-19]
MEPTSSTTVTETRVEHTRAETVGTLAMVAGALFALGALVSSVVDWAWFAILIGFALLVYVVPQLHRVQSPADGWAGRAGSMLVAAGAGLVVALGVVFLVLEAVGDPGEPAWGDVLWMIGFLAFLVGIVLFAVGSAIGRRVPPGAPLLMLFGLVAAVAIDMATGAFFEDDSSTTEWGVFIGVPLFGLGLAWMGYALRTASARPRARS